MSEPTTDPVMFQGAVADGIEPSDNEKDENQNIENEMSGSKSQDHDQADGEDAPTKMNTMKEEPENVEVTKAKEKVYKIKSQIDDLVDQFFESKLEKVKNNEQMIVNYKFQPKIRQAQDRLKHIEHKVEE